MNLPEQLNSNIESMINESDLLYDKKLYKESIDLLLNAWAELPSPKEAYDQSYYISNYLSITYLELKDYSNAIKWGQILQKCDLNRADSGGREFILGKIYYESGNLQEAKEQFAIAMKKSEGRAFQGEPQKYIDLLKK